MKIALRRCSAAPRVTAAAGLRRHYGSLILADHDGKSMAKSTAHVVSGCSQLPGATEHSVLVCGKDVGKVAEECAALTGVSKVLVVDSDAVQNAGADKMAELLVAMQKDLGFKVIAGANSSDAKDILPRVGAKLDVQPITDVLKVGDEAGVYERPMYAGNAIATVKSKDETQILTFRTTAFEAAEAGGSGATEDFAAPSLEGAGQEFVSQSEKADDKPQLGSAPVVVSGGRALQNAENFEKVLQPLCDAMGAAMGASRAAVDAGFVPNEMQVGQTGKVVAPNLYVAVGISGAIQHLAGMKDSKTIVAINKDADAPIFQIADVGLVADLFEAVPEMTGKVS